MVLVKNWHFFHIIILGKRGQGNVFYDILERKNAFLDHKNKLKKVEKLGFSKGFHCFGQNLAIDLCYYFREKMTMQMCFTIF